MLRAILISFIISITYQAHALTFKSGESISSSDNVVTSQPKKSDQNLDDYSEGNSEWVEFQSVTYEEGQYLSNNGKPVTVKAELRTPPGKGPFPAIVMIHSSGGEIISEEYIRAFHKRSIATLDVRVYESRGGTKREGRRKSPANAVTGVYDALNALSYLRSRDDIIDNKIGVIGWSYGGVVANNSRIAFHRKWASEEFDYHIAYYPFCWLYENDETTGKPILFLLAELDQITPADQCITYVSQTTNAEMRVFKGAHHSFDSSLALRPIDREFDLMNKDCVLHQMDDGREIFGLGTSEEFVTYEIGNDKLATRENLPQKVAEGCFKRGHPLTGRDAKADAEARQKMMEFITPFAGPNVKLPAVCKYSIKKQVKGDSKQYTMNDGVLTVIDNKLIKFGRNSGFSGGKEVAKQDADIMATNTLEIKNNKLKGKLLLHRSWKDVAAGKSPGTYKISQKISQDGNIQGAYKFDYGKNNKGLLFISGCEE